MEFRRNQQSRRRAGTVLARSGRVDTPAGDDATAPHALFADTEAGAEERSTVRIAYLILAHHCPGQLRRLIERLAGPQTRFYVHIDRKAAPEVAATVAGIDGVHLVPPIACRWGDISLIRAILRCLDAALSDHGFGFNVAVLLSGQDYPIKPRREIEAALQARAGRSTMLTWKLPASQWANERGGLERYEHWNLRIGRRFFPIFGPRGFGNKVVDAAWNGLARRIPLRRRFPAGLTPHGGSVWWALARADAEMIVSRLAAEPQLLRFFRYVKIPDEMLVQSLLMSSPGGERVVNEGLHFIRWPPLGATSPAVLTAGDFEALAAAPEPFARKFDERVDRAVLDLIDRHLL